MIEILNSNKNYNAFRTSRMSTTTANLAELHYYAFRTQQTFAMREAVKRMEPELSSPTLDDWKQAAEFKFLHRKKRISLIDGLGYELAQKHGLRFLTGDQQFKGMTNVEYIK